MRASSPATRGAAKLLPVASRRMPPFHGTLSGTAPNLIYTPTPNFFGTDEVRFRASDGKANSNEAVRHWP